MAAAAVIVLALGLGYMMGGQERGPEPPPARPSEVVTGPGESSTTHLPDGTVIRLGPESRLTIPGDRELRQVRLEGTAFFAVASDSVAPFVVATSAGNARVLGTRFELSAQASDLRLVVVDGKVALGSGDTEVEVNGSEVSHVSAGGTPTVTPVDDVWALLAWMGGFLAFESTPLQEVGSELQERFGVNLVFDDPTLAEETVTVWFGDEGIEQVATVLCRLVEASCTVEESSIVMRRAP
jgi:transmembrane sensor